MLSWEISKLKYSACSNASCITLWSISITWPQWPYSSLETQTCWLTISAIIGHTLVKLCTSTICIDIYAQNYRLEMFAHRRSLNLVLISILGMPYWSDVLSIHWSHCSMDIQGINIIICWINLSYYNMHICCKQTLSKFKVLLLKCHKETWLEDRQNVNDWSGRS